MHTYQAQTFNLPALDGISEKQVKVHLGLYEGYVKHINVLREQIKELSEDAEKHAFAIAEVRRRLGFEFNGMRMHEYYFSQFEGGPQVHTGGHTLEQVVTEKYGSWDAFITHLAGVAMSRGIGWTVLYHDPIGNTPHVAWVGDHELGQLAGLPVILALDMWEHAYMVDYTPADKKQYVEAFFKNLNWGVVEERFLKL